MIDTLIIKLMSLAVHAEEYVETGHPFDANTIRAMLNDPEIKAKRQELDKMGLLPVKRNGSDE